MKPAPFEHVAVDSEDAAIAALAQHGGEAKVLAGGQSLVPMLNMRLSRPAVLVDINRVGGLDRLAESNGALSVGALVRQHALERWAAERCPLVAEALRSVGHLAIRTRGTVAGSIAHADPASELPALLLCLDGAVTARRASGERTVSADDLFVAPLVTALEPDELMTEVRFSLPPPGAGWGFAEVARRHGDFALVGAAALLSRGGDGRVTRARLAFFGVGDTPVRGEAAESALTGHAPTPAAIRDAARAAADALTPDDDLHATASYRKRAAAVLAERTLSAALDRCRSAA